jgi:uncharacterized repeat protein (TIGR01451 family)
MQARRRWNAFVRFASAIVAFLALLPAMAVAQECPQSELTQLVARGQMPDLHGCPERTAMAILGARHRPTIKDGTSNRVQPGSVYAQAPNPSTPLDAGLPITLWVSRGPEAEDIDHADLVVTARARKPRRVEAGGSDTFQFRIQNRGPAVASGVTMRAQGTNFQDLVVRGSCKGGPCDVLQLAPGAAINVRVAGLVPEAGAYGVDLIATFAGELDPGNNTAHASNTAIPAPEGVTTPPVGDTSPASAGKAEIVTKLAVDEANSTFTKGGYVRYRITLFNRGPATATQVELRTSNPTNIQVISLSACASDPCALGTIAPNQPLTIAGQSRILDVGPFSSTFRVSWRSGAKGPITLGGVELLGTATSGISEAAPVRRLPWWVWTIGGLAGAYLVWALLLKPMLAKQSLPARATQPDPSHAWDSRIGVHVTLQPQGYTELVGEIPLAARPFSVTVSLRAGDADPLDDIPAWKKDG